MKVLIVIERSPAQRYLVRLHTDELIREVTDLIKRKRHSRAIMSVLSKGRFEKEVQYHEIPNLKADLILSEDFACWDLTK